MKIKAYLKPHCGWSKGVRAIFKKYTLDYDDIDIINHPENYAEMVEKSGQNLSPCVEIDGVMLADVSGEEVEAYMLQNKPEIWTPGSQPCKNLVKYVYEPADFSPSHLSYRRRLWCMCGGRCQNENEQMHNVRMIVHWMWLQARELACVQTFLRPGVHWL